MSSSLPEKAAAHYEPVRVLARGGCGEVVLAHDRRLDRQVVVKLLLSGLLEDEEQVSRFNAEARVTAMLRHPNIVVVLDHDVVDGVPYIVYEYLEGLDLQSRLEQGPLPLECAARAIVQVCDALQAAHDRGILHRDVKGPNVLSAGPEHHKLTDFGIAKWQNRPAAKTQTGMVLGTPTHLAPELIRGAGASPESDLYATGILLFELLTGRPPFPGPNISVILESHLNRKPPPAGSLRPGIPGTLEEVIARALAKVPGERFPSASSMGEALQEILPSLETTASSSEDLVRPRSQQAAASTTAVRQRATASTTAAVPRLPAPSRRGRVLAATGLLTAVLGLVFFPSRPREEPPILLAPESEPSVAVTSRLDPRLPEWFDKLKQLRKLVPRWREGTMSEYEKNLNFDRGDQKLAEKLVNELLAPDVDAKIRDDVHLFKAILEERRGKFESARKTLEEYERVRAEDEYIPEIKKRLAERIARDEIENGQKLNVGIDDAAKVLETDPARTVTSITSLLAEWGYGSGEIPLNLRDGFSRALLTRGSARQKLEQYEEALKDADEAIAVVPENYWAHLLRGEILERTDTAAAEAAYDVAILRPESSKAHLLLGRLVARRDRARAIEILKGGIDRFRDSGVVADLRVELGLTLAAEGDHSEAIELLERGLEASTNPVGPWQKLFELEHRQGLHERIGIQLDRLRARDRKRACEEAEHLVSAAWFTPRDERWKQLAIRLESQDPDCSRVFELLYEHYEQSRDDRAREALVETGLKRDRPPARAVKVRADSLHDLEKYREALDLLKDVEGKRELTFGELLTRTNCLISAGDLQGARRNIEQARQLSPDDPWLSLQEAQILWREGRLDAAEAIYSSQLDNPYAGPNAREQLNKLRSER